MNRIYIQSGSEPSVGDYGNLRRSDRTSEAGQGSAFRHALVEVV